MSDRIAELLADGLDWEVKRHFARAYEAMWRDLDYLAGAGERRIDELADRGWSRSRLRAVIVLNAFYCVFRATRGGRSKPTRGRVPRRRESERSDGRGQGLVSVSFSFILARALRIEPPRRLTTWALWTRRSQIASAIVASPIA